VCFPEPADADRLAQVDVAGDGGRAYVEPVGGLRGEFVRMRSFDRVNPACLMARDVLVWILGILEETSIWGPGAFCALAGTPGLFLGPWE
jgi:hypothetical protein